MDNLQLPDWVIVPLLVLTLWSLFWKGLALWHSARKNDTSWFVVLLLVNSVGILEIIYLFSVAKLKFSQLFNQHR